MSRTKKVTETVEMEENKGMENIDTMELDTTPQEQPMIPIVPSVVEEPVNTKAPSASGKKLINCLRNERIIVRFVPSPTAMIQQKNHVLYGGMAENAKRSFVVPRLSSTGIYKNVLTDSEKEYLEYAMGLELGALSIYKRKDNFWDDSNPNGIGRVTLHKQDNYFDLSLPEQYIQYKILLANKDQIASSLQELEEHPKATYQFVIIAEDAETKSNLSKMDATMQCYTEYGAIRQDADKLRVIIELLEKRPQSSKVSLDYLQGKINEYIQRDPRKFLAVIKDDYLNVKVLIRLCVEGGLIGMKNNTYYLREDGSPLCEIGEESTLNMAAKYLASPMHQELKYRLEAKLKD